MVDDETYGDLQFLLAKEPNKGDVIRGTGGLRKIRMAARGKGKRGGARVIYHYMKLDETIYMIFVYGKDEMDDLSSDQKKRLIAMSKEITTQHLLKRQ